MPSGRPRRTVQRSQDLWQELRRAYEKLRGQSEEQRDQNKHPQAGEKLRRRRRIVIASFVTTPAPEFRDLGSRPIPRDTTHASTPKFSPELAEPACEQSSALVQDHEDFS